MRTRGAVVTKAPGTYEVIEMELDDPRQGEIRVKMVASGLCHSDDHLATGDIPVGVYPFAGGHEGAGIVDKVGPNTPGFEEGDHVVFSFLPGCGRCRWCAAGMQNLCDLGAGLLLGSRFEDPESYRLTTLDGQNVGQMCGISTFCEYTVVSLNSAVKVDKDLPLDRVCLLGCGVGTGWGSAVNSAAVRPGDTVIVMGIGGIGINAVQGAAHAGASNVIAVDPVQFKREKAMELGATHTFADIAEADEFAKSVTNGQGADSVIVTIGVVKGEHVGQAFAATRKAGTVVVTGLGDITEVGIPVSIGELTLFQKRIQGSLFGESSPSSDILKQAQMYRDGKLKLDELVTTTYTLDEVAKGYEDMHAGKNIRGMIIF
ncbi:NDMA-dependent alcohol dehydrogenase [Acidiferrimicrobium sp. IK]|uniref:NDMA-dependent alcohol dehydrogenase n=1 Tax=Acidiferrimicrobium sp. IK TaxID=2871700 RepID=UPI0021CB18C5|nr:NDMA-dependent alcohol dehydrogenase [Acidiferrimicrobium sp. IK]MCU4185356.1 NDMA-dependent alcohol dehydrogenase [Acidiferrimicrobium sp. IK]